jgi:hypothetical protein
MAAAPSIDFRVNGKYYYDFFLNSTGTSYLKQLQDFVKAHTPETKTGTVSGTEVGGKKQESGNVAPTYIQELRELGKLRDDGIISEEEFQAKKRKLLNLETQEKPSSAKANEPKKPKEGAEKPPISPPPN